MCLPTVARMKSDFKAKRGYRNKMSIDEIIFKFDNLRNNQQVKFTMISMNNIQNYERIG